MDAGGSEVEIFGGINMKPWADRSRTQMQVMPLIQRQLNAVAGTQTVAFPLPTLPGSSRGLPIQFVLTSTRGYRDLDRAANRLIGAAMKSGLFAFLTTDLRYDSPNISLDINRDVAANLGLNMQDIGKDLSALLSENYVGRFDMSGHSYEIIPQVPNAMRANVNALSSYYIRTAGGALVPLTTVVKTRRSVQPEYLPQFQQFNSATIEGTMAPSVPLGQALGYLKKLSARVLPAGFNVDYSGESRQFIQQGNAIIVTFVLSILLVFLFLGAATLNIYTEVGLITLIGLITKQSILIVQFANVIQQEEGLDRRAAVEKASSIRLRPILMTTLAMVFGVVALLVAHGPGAVSRFDMGLVIATGLTIGAPISLYVVPTIYTYVAKEKAAAPSVPQEAGAGAPGSRDPARAAGQ